MKGVLFKALLCLFLFALSIQPASANSESKSYDRSEPETDDSGSYRSPALDPYQIGEWDIHLDGLNWPLWGLQAVAGLGLHLTLHGLSNYLIVWGTLNHSPAVLLLGQNSLRLANAYSLGTLAQRSLTLSTNVIDAASHYLSGHSQPLPGSSVFNNTHEAESPSQWTNSLIHYHQDEQGRKQVLINNEVTRYLLEVLLIPVIISQTKKLAALTQEASARVEAGEQDVLVVIDLDSELPLPEPEIIESLAKVDSLIATVPDALKDQQPDTVSNVPVLPKFMPVKPKRFVPVFYLKAEEVYHPNKLRAIRQNLETRVFDWFGTFINHHYKNSVRNSPVAITGGQALQLYHRNLLGLRRDQYRALTSFGSFSTNDLDIYVSQVPMLKRMFDSARLELGDLRVHQEKVYSLGRPFHPKQLAEPVYSIHLYTIKDNKMITLYGVDLIQSSLFANFREKVVATDQFNGVMLPVMNYQHELSRLAIALTNTKGKDDFNKYLVRLFMIGQAEGGKLSRHQAESVLPDSLLVQMIRDHFSDLKELGLYETDRSARQALGRFINDQGASRRSIALANIESVSTLSPTANQKTESVKSFKSPAYSSSNTFSESESAEPNLSRKAKAVLKQKYGKKKSGSFKSWAYITPVVVLASVSWLAVSKKDSSKKQKTMVIQVLPETEGALSANVQRHYDLYHSWRMEAYKKVFNLGCSKFIPEGVTRKLCEKYYSSQHYLALYLLNLLSIRDEGNMMPFWALNSDSQPEIIGLVRMNELPAEEIRKLIDLNLAAALAYVGQYPMHVAMLAATLSTYFCGYFPGTFADMTLWYDACMGSMQENAPRYMENNEISGYWLRWQLMQKSMRTIERPGQYVLALPKVSYKGEKSVAPKMYLADFDGKKLVLEPYQMNDACSALGALDEKLIYEAANVVGIDTAVGVSEECTLPLQLRLCPDNMLNANSIPFLGVTNEQQPTVHLWTYKNGKCIPSPWSRVVCESYKTDTN